MQAAGRRDSTLELARALWTRRKWLAVLAFSAAFLAAASLTLALPNLYRASATVLVEQEVPEALARAGAAGELEPRLQLVTQEILSRARLQALIERFDLYPKLRRAASPEDVLDRMRRDIRLERKEVQQRWGPGSTVAFTLSYQSWNPQIAAQVTNLLVSYYVEENRRILGRQTAGSQAAGTVDQITPLKRQLAELRSRFSDRYPDVVKLKAEIAALERHRPAAAPPAAAVAGAQRPGDQFRILDPAVAPRDPFAPNRVRLLVMSLVLSFGVAAVAVLVAEQLDTSFHRVDDLREFTSVPVLAMILRIETRGDVWRQRLRLGAATALSAMAMVLIFKVFYTAGRSGEQLVWILAQPGGGT